MDLQQASRIRNWLGKVGACLCILMFLSLLDFIVSKFREPVDAYKVFPGASLEITGPLWERVPDIEKLVYFSSSDKLHLSFTGLYQGYWMGGDMWRGLLTASPDLEAGEYSLSVTIQGKNPPKPPPVFRIVVYPDSLSQRLSSTSLIRRYTGLIPWVVGMALVPFIASVFGLVFLLSYKMEGLLAQMGKAEVYRVKKMEGGYLLNFGLGTAHGVQLGARLPLFDEEGQPMGTVEVKETALRDSLALIISDREIRPGFVVTLQRA